MKVPVTIPIILISIVIILIGVIVCTAWVLNVPALMQILPNAVPMQFNTALMFLFLGAGLMAAHFQSLWLSRGLAVVVGLFSVLTFSQYLTGIGLGLDQLFMRAYLLTQTSHPGRMAPNTAIAFVLSATALYLMTSPRGRTWSGVLATVVLALGLVSLLGYAFGVQAAYGWGQYTRMAVHTTVGFVLVSTALLLWFLDHGQEIETVSELPWMGLFAALFLSILCILFWQALRVEDASQLELQLQQKANSEAMTLSGIAQERLLAIDRMALRYAGNGYIQDGVWKSDAQLYFKTMPSINRILVLDTKARILEQLNATSGLADPAFPEDLLQDVPREGCTITSRVPFIWFACSRQKPQGKAIHVLARADFFVAAQMEIERQARLGYVVQIVGSTSESIKSNQLMVKLAQTPRPLPPLWVSVSFTPKNRLAVVSRLPDVLLVAGLIVAVLLATIFVQQNKLKLANEKILASNQVLFAKSQALAASNESLEQFAYAASHDLKAPVRTMVSYAQLIGMSDKTSPISSIDDSLEEIVKAGKDLYGMVDTLLEVSRAGHITAESIQRADMREVIDIAVSRLGSLINERGAQIEIGEMPSLDTEPGLMAQVMQNLIANAIKYQPGLSPYIGVFATREAQGWIISVVDRGSGIAPEQQEEIFKLFRRGGQDDIEGSGIGLSVVRRIVTGLGGRVWVESTPGKGSSFKVFHPTSPM